jgi:hypothetical protein
MTNNNWKIKQLRMHLRRPASVAQGSQLAVSDASDFGWVETGGRLSPFRVVRVGWIDLYHQRPEQVGTIV